MTTMIGTAGADTLTGTAERDYIVGMAGDDVLVSGAGADWIEGGAGADRFVFKQGDGWDSIGDFKSSEGDRLDLRAWTGIHGINDLTIATGEDGDAILVFSNNDTLRLEGVKPAELTPGNFQFAPQPAASWEATLRVMGTPVSPPDGTGPTTLAPVLLWGAYATGGNVDPAVTVDWGDGTVEPRTLLSDWPTGIGHAYSPPEAASNLWGSITFDGPDGTMTETMNLVSAQSTNGEVLTGGGDHNALFGNHGNDTLIGGDSGDGLFGGNGNDRLEGGSGKDMLIGGTGADIFVFRQGDGADRIDDFNFSDGDRLDAGGRAYSVSYQDWTVRGWYSATVDFGGGDSVVITGNYGSGLGAVTVSNSWFV
ncbi:hypothetical protein [Azospirillum picis]